MKGKKGEKEKGKEKKINFLSEFYLLDYRRVS